MTFSPPTLGPRERAARLALKCLDLTSLKDDDCPASIEALARRAQTRHGVPAALCVYPQFATTARHALDELGLAQVLVATVVNFPHGGTDVDRVVQEIDEVLAAGAREIDAVFPWRTLQAGDKRACIDLVSCCRRACDAAGKPVRLKLILETGGLREPRLIREASEIALTEGADFLKTSTGKLPINATSEAVGCMLEVIREHGRRVGLMVAGGVTTLAQVQAYLELATQVYGEAALSPTLLRFGASSLLPALVAALDDSPAPDGDDAGGAW